MKTLLSLALGGFVFAGFLGAADFSKKTDKELIDIVGSLQPNDVPDFLIEENKRLKAKNEEDAKAFRKALGEKRKEAFKALSDEEKKKRGVEVCKAIQAKTDSMSGKQIRESGLRIMPFDCDKEPPKHIEKFHKHGENCDKGPRGPKDDKKDKKDKKD